MDNSATFSINLIGDKTGELHKGDFSAKKRLTHRDELRKDRVYRDLLGPSSDLASTFAKDRAEILSSLSVSLSKTPSWWLEKGEGLDLEDDNLVAEIYAKVMEIRLQAYEEVKSKALKDAEELKSKLENK